MPGFQCSSTYRAVSFLLILILPPILFRQFKKFSKLLHSLRLHRSCIHLPPIMLQPRIIFTSLLRIILRWIPLIRLNKCHHLIVSRCPSLILCHTSSLHFWISFIKSFQSCFCVIANWIVIGYGLNYFSRPLLITTQLEHNTYA